jgi:hypothetical protein
MIGALPFPRAAIGRHHATPILTGVQDGFSQVLQQLRKLFHAEACLLDDGSDCFAFEVPVMIGHRDAKSRTIRMFQGLDGR